MNPDANPTSAQRTTLITRLVNLGYSSTTLAAIIKSGRTRRQIANDLIALQRRASKA